MDSEVLNVMACHERRHSAFVTVRDKSNSRDYGNG
jgi:hypothetical protein